MVIVFWILSCINKIIIMFIYFFENKVLLKVIFYFGVINSFIINVDVNGYNCNYFFFMNVIYV